MYEENAKAPDNFQPSDLLFLTQILPEQPGHTDDDQADDHDDCIDDHGEFDDEAQLGVQLFPLGMVKDDRQDVQQEGDEEADPEKFQFSFLGPGSDNGILHDLFL